MLDTTAAGKADHALFDSSVSGVLLQFALVRKDEVPPGLWMKDVQRVLRRDTVENTRPKTPGVCVVQKTKLVSLLAFVGELKQTGLVMTRFTTKEWQDRATNEPRQAVQYIFNRLPFAAPVAEPLAGFIEQYGIPSLLRLCTGSRWTIQVWRNPLGDERFGFSVSAEHRKPYGGGEMRLNSTLRIKNNRVVLA